MQTPTKHALNQTCSIQVQRVQASLEGKDVIAATAIKKQAEGHRYMFPPLDIWLSTTVMSCALKTPDQALTWTFHFTQIQDSTASVARQFFAVALKSPKQAINNSRCAKHTAAMIRLIQLCWTMFGKWTSAEYSTCRWHCTSSSPWTCKKPNKSISESEHKILYTKVTGKISWGYTPFSTL